MPMLFGPENEAEVGKRFVFIPTLAVGRKRLGDMAHCNRECIHAFPSWLQQQAHPKFDYRMR